MQKEARGSFSIAIIFVSILFVMLGTFWLLTGIKNDVSELVLQGSIIPAGGMGIGGLANFLKF